MATVELDIYSNICKGLADRVAKGKFVFEKKVFEDNIENALLEVNFRKCEIKHKSEIEYNFKMLIGVSPSRKNDGDIDVILAYMLSCYMNVNPIGGTKSNTDIQVISWKDCNLYNDDYVTFINDLKISVDLGNKAKGAVYQIGELRKQLDYALLMTPEFNLGASDAIATKASITMQLMQLQTILTQAAEVRKRRVDEAIIDSSLNKPSKLTMYGLSVMGKTCTFE